jgi:hypothetical protein
MFVEIAPNHPPEDQRRASYVQDYGSLLSVLDSQQPRATDLQCRLLVPVIRSFLSNTSASEATIFLRGHFFA